jgi:hypothetical protein
MISYKYEYMINRTTNIEKTTIIATSGGCRLQKTPRHHLHTYTHTGAIYSVILHEDERARRRWRGECASGARLVERDRESRAAVCSAALPPAGRRARPPSCLPPQQHRVHTHICIYKTYKPHWEGLTHCYSITHCHQSIVGTVLNQD